MFFEVNNFVLIFFFVIIILDLSHVNCFISSIKVWNLFTTIKKFES